MGSDKHWEVVGGAEKGGILVREGAELKARELQPRLGVGAVVEQVGELHGERLCYRKVSGPGPESGWVSIRVKDKQLLKELRDERENPESGKQGQGPLDLALAALAVDSSSASGHQAVAKLDACLEQAAPDAPSELLLARGLLNWRLARFERAHADLQEAARTSTTAAPALLALLLCCSRFPDALALCDSLGEKDVHSLVEQWRSEAEKLSNLFFPCVREPCSKPKEIFDGIRQTDMLFHAADGIVLGLRLLLQHDNGKARLDRPLVLVFHGEDENIDSFCEEGNFEPWRAAKVNLLIADFRGYGFSSGTSSHYNLRTDGDLICDALPKLLGEVAWPWPGGLALYGHSLGSRVACYLAAMRNSAFPSLVLETGWCGSYAPGAQPLPEPPQHTALATMGCNAAGDSRFGSRDLHMAAAAITRKARKLLAAPFAGIGANMSATAAATNVAHFCFMKGNEDLIQGFDGRVLILHGDVDHVVPSAHARRLFAAVSSASKRLVLAKGKRQDSLRGSTEYAEALYAFFNEADKK
ncbi:unnamed protein product [Symbiodinium necroappetens]|uniref:Serine aminopeptidase S33 domain-containing protein n=2 Tax=Symbiodinium TaxID=2949 RepID=A0A813BNW9_9DINO|nr:hypothetical protein AK812_SmicGene17230 [Symbiodinium microadriaticum]CAE7225638.1 unnamed protein product [Symbiodinium sp. KB8]CAE7293414.1 unnamed protein product [Symbiodinium microadriaticum]CAE7915377.1 unnamed protein product [Symbiodinium necroappetens]